MGGPSGTSTGRFPQRVQVPIELAPSEHRRLAEWCRGIAADLEVKAVSLGEVLETMIDLVLTDPRTAGAVRQRLANSAPPGQL